jgi:ABC-type molybdate transport system substrate-binding protein
MAVDKGGKNQAAAGKFMDFLKSPETAGVFGNNRFVPLTGRKRI